MRHHAATGWPSLGRLYPTLAFTAAGASPAHHRHCPGASRSQMTHVQTFIMCRGCPCPPSHPLGAGAVSAPDTRSNQLQEAWGGPNTVAYNHGAQNSCARVAICHLACPWGPRGQAPQHGWGSQPLWLAGELGGADGIHGSPEDLRGTWGSLQNGAYTRAAWT